MCFYHYVTISKRQFKFRVESEISQYQFLPMNFPSLNVGLICVQFMNKFGTLVNAICKHARAQFSIFFKHVFVKYIRLKVW